jgi:hypothetical protein
VESSPVREFGDVSLHVYENSNGLAEIAVNQGRADRDLGLTIGISVDRPLNEGSPSQPWSAAMGVSRKQGSKTMPIGNQQGALIHI